MSSMTTIDDLPAPVVRLITRYARTRHIPGTNRFARVCRSWRDAAVDSDEQEQLQLLLALEGLPPDAVTSTSAWLAHHGTCVDALHIIYNPATAALYQQLPLATAPLVSLARLEVDGPDSLVALAPALPQLVALTHLGATISVTPRGSSQPYRLTGVFSDAQGAPLDTPPCLQQLCPGLKSLDLDLGHGTRRSVRLLAPVAQLLPDHLEQLHIQYHGPCDRVIIHCGDLEHYTSLWRLTLKSITLLDPDKLLLTPAVKEVGLGSVDCCMNGQQLCLEQWLPPGLCTAPQHLTKLTGVSMSGRGPHRSFRMPQQHTALSGLRKLHMYAVGPDTPAAVQQLSGLRSLQHLSLYASYLLGEEARPVLSALSSVQQLTCLRLRSIGWVPASTWAAVLPHLTCLRVLAVGWQPVMASALVAELQHLTRLQCLYLAQSSDPGYWSLASSVAEVAPHLQVLSAHSSLRAVLCWWAPTSFCQEPEPHPVWEDVHEGRLHVSCWHGWGAAAEEGRVVLPRACPHLPGVWELQQEPADD